MRAALLALVLSCVASAQGEGMPNIEGPIYQSSLLAPYYAAPYAWFEFAPESGAGMGAECACAAVTGAKGETVTYSRTGGAYCTKSNKTTGLVSGDMVLCAANQPRVMRASASSSLGLLSESARTNLVIQSDAFDDAAWTAVGTPVESANTVVTPWGAMTGDTLEDDDGAGDEGEAQTLATTATNPSVLSVYVKAGTLDSLRLTNDATECAFTSLSTTQWTRVQCPDTSASGASTVQQILLGAEAADTGTMYFAGAQFETGTGVTKASSYVPTTSAAVARGADAPSTDASAWPIDATGCFGATVSSAGGGASLTGAYMVDSRVGSASGAVLYVGSATTVTMRNAPNTAVATKSSLTFSASTDYRVWGSWDATNWTAAQDALTAAAASALGSGAHSSVTEFCTAPNSGSYLCRKVQADPNPTRCR